MRGLIILVAVIVGAFVLAVVVGNRFAAAPPPPKPTPQTDSAAKLKAEIERQRVAFDSQQEQADQDRMIELKNIADHGKTPTERRTAQRALKKLEETVQAKHDADEQTAAFTAHVAECCNMPAALQSAEQRAQCAAWGVERCAGR